MAASTGRRPVPYPVSGQRLLRDHRFFSCSKGQPIASVGLGFIIIWLVDMRVAVCVYVLLVVYVIVVTYYAQC